MIHRFTLPIVLYTRFLQCVTIMIGLCAFVFLLWEPHVEGRNLHATMVEIYFNDPFLIYAYTSSLPFFVGVKEAWTFLGLVGHNQAHAPRALLALRRIRHCAIILASCVMSGVAFLVMFWRGRDDIAGGVAMGLMVTMLSLVVASTARVLEYAILPIHTNEPS
jgi:hypothetical protein